MIYKQHVISVYYIANLKYLLLRLLFYEMFDIAKPQNYIKEISDNYH